MHRLSGVTSKLSIGLAVAVILSLAGCQESDAGSDTATGRTAASTATISKQTPGGRQGEGLEVSAAPPTRGAAQVARPAGSPPPLIFEPAVLSFGYIQPNVNSVGMIKITNGGQESLTIVKATPTCACTTLTAIAGTTLAPGEFFEMEARLEGRAMAGPRRAAIKFLVAGYDQTVQIDLNAEVSQAVRATPAILNLATGEWSGHLIVESLDRRPFTILSANHREPVFQDFDPDIDEPTTRYVLKWDLSYFKDTDLSTLPHWYVVETDHPEAPVVDSWVRHRVTIDINPTRRWRVKDRRLLLPMIAKGETYEYVAEVAKLQRETIVKVQSLSDQFDARLVNLERKGIESYVTVAITPKPGFTGVLHGKIEFVSRLNTQTIDVVGKVAG